MLDFYEASLSAKDECDFTAYPCESDEDADAVSISGDFNDYLCDSDEGADALSIVSDFNSHPCEFIENAGAVTICDTGCKKLSYSCKDLYYIC